MSESDLFNITRSAEYLTVKPGTIRKWIQIGRIPVTKLGGCVRIQKHFLDELIEASTGKKKATR